MNQQEHIINQHTQHIGLTQFGLPTMQRGNPIIQRSLNGRYSQYDCFNQKSENMKHVKPNLCGDCLYYNTDTKLCGQSEQTAPIPETATGCTRFIPKDIRFVDVVPQMHFYDTDKLYNTSR